MTVLLRDKVCIVAGGFVIPTRAQSIPSSLLQLQRRIVIPQSAD